MTDTTATIPTLPEAAPLLTRVLAQARFELRSIVSNGEQLFLCFALPLAALIGLALSEVITVLGYTDAERGPIAAAAGLGLAIAASAFTGQAITTGFDRRYGVLRQLATTPLGARGLILAKIVAVFVITAAQFVLIIIAVALLPIPFPFSFAPSAVAGLLLSWVLGTASLVALALALAGTVRAEAVLALSNLLWVAGAAAGGLVVQHPGLWGTLAGLTPFGALGDSLRAALLHAAVDWKALVVLAVWAIVGVVAGAKWFSFESK